MQATARSLSITAIAVTFTVLMTLGGWRYYLAAIIITGVFVGLDLVSGMETEDPEYRHPGQMNLQLYLVLPLMVVYLVFYAWFLGGYLGVAGDPLGLGAAFQHVTGIDLLAVRTHTNLPELIVGAYCLGTIWAGFGTVVGHELTHRTWSKTAMIVGRWLLALTCEIGRAHV